MCLYLFVRSSFILSSAASLRTHLSVSTSKAAGRQPSAAAQPASIVSNTDSSRTVIPDGRETKHNLHSEPDKYNVIRERGFLAISFNFAMIYSIFMHFLHLEYCRDDRPGRIPLVLND